MGAQDKDKYKDPVVEAYKAGIDRSLLRENLKLTPEERLRNAMAHMKFADELRAAGKRLRARAQGSGKPDCK